MVVGTYFTHKSLTSFMKIQKSSKIFKPSIHKFVSAGTNVAKIWLTLYFMGCVRFTWYCGKMYSCHLFSYGGFGQGKLCKTVYMVEG